MNARRPETHFQITTRPSAVSRCRTVSYNRSFAILYSSGVTISKKHLMCCQMFGRPSDTSFTANSNTKCQPKPHTPFLFHREYTVLVAVWPMMCCQMFSELFA